MLAALLQGRAQFTFGELRHRNHLLLYTHLLGILELVQPALFHPDYSAPFSQTIHAYCQLIHVSMWVNTMDGFVAICICIFF